MAARDVYPEPTIGTDVTYSGGLVWTQGTMGDDTITSLKNLNKTPMDPLTGNEYTYSATQSRTEYQIAAMLESGGEIGFRFPLLDEALAAGTEIATAFVV